MPLYLHKTQTMVTIHENASLKTYNTFGIDAKCERLCFYEKPEDIAQLIKQKSLQNHPIMIMGGGSNLMFINNFKGTIIHPNNTSIKVVRETDTEVFIKAGAGVVWDNLVKHCVENGWGGIENLSDIPGNVGASPVQNIGAYGVEAKDTIHEVNLVSLHDASTKTLNNSACEFAYRMSIFKTQLKDQYLVDSVVYRLQKSPKLVIHYGSLEKDLEGIKNPNIQDIRDIIIKVRGSKLPNPEKTGNAGSFFKNPVIDSEQAKIIKLKFPELVTYPANEGKTKLAAGWLIDQCGLKGYTNEKGTAGFHDKQALVLVNHGNATGQDLLKVSQLAQEKVLDKFGVKLEPEVLIIK